jgi:hypothetical protein
MNSILDKRLAKLEQVHIPPAEQRERQKFYVEGYGDDDPAEFLRSCGHDVKDGDIIRQIVAAAPQGGPLFAPFVDVTAEIRGRS